MTEKQLTALLPEEIDKCIITLIRHARDSRRADAEFKIAEIKSVISYATRAMMRGNTLDMLEAYQRVKELE